MREEAFSNYKKEVFSFTFDYLNFGRFDAGGVLHHAAYYHLLEDIRERYLLANNLSYKGLMELGYHLPIVEAKQSFIKPIYYNEKVSGHLFLGEIGKSSVSFEHELKNEAGETTHLTTTTHVAVKTTNNKFKPSALPEQLKKLLGA